jgi:hypothetical protein
MTPSLLHDGNALQVKHVPRGFSIEEADRMVGAGIGR